MILSDVDVKRMVANGSDIVEPFDPAMCQPASYDLTLAASIWVPDQGWMGVIDFADPPSTDDTGNRRVIEDSWVIEPGGFILGSTAEKVHVPGSMSGVLEGKSSLGRSGLVVHATAGFIDPGFNGCLTLELANIGKLPVRIRPGMKIAQVMFMKMYSMPSGKYGDAKFGSHYQDQGDRPVTTR